MPVIGLLGLGLLEQLSANAGLLLAVGAIALALGVGAGQFRAGKLRGAGEALNVAQAELEIHRERGARLEQDVIRYKAEQDKLTGVVEQLREENKELRALLMGDKVQPAMLEAMQAVAMGSREAYKLLLDDALRPVVQMLADLTAKRG